MAQHAFHECNEEKCFVCDGGLGLCTICGGAEGSLPTHCPGDTMRSDVSDAVYAGKIDYRDGAWIRVATCQQGQPCGDVENCPDPVECGHVDFEASPSPATEGEPS